MPLALPVCETGLKTSSRTGFGIAALRDELRRQALAAGRRDGDVVAGTAVRCAESLRLAGECLQRAHRVAADGQDELAAAEIRTSLTELGKVVGAVQREFTQIYPKPGSSPYCNLNCRGYGIDAQGNEIYANPCNATPCDAMLYSLFQPGSHSIQLVRLVVYT